MSDQNRASEADTGGLDIEGTARRMGWKPQEEYKGPADKWRPAADFVAAGFEELPLLRNRYKTLDAKSEKQEKQLTEAQRQIGEMSEVMIQIRDGQSARDRALYDRARAEIKAEMQEAVRGADPAALDVAMAKLDKLEAEKPEAAPAPKKKEEAAAGEVAPEKKKEPEAAAATDKKLTIAPEVAEWIEKNPWYNDNLELNNAAVFAERRIRDKPEFKDSPLSEILDAVTAEIETRFPEHFPKSQREAAAAVGRPNGGGGGGGGGKQSRPKGRSYADLPAEAKADHDRFIKMQVKGKDGKMVPFMTSDKYLDDYPWSN